jgi:P4 family phage/plasmid primase-like protien
MFQVKVSSASDAVKKRLNGLLKFKKLEIITKLAAKGKDGLSYKHNEDESRMIVGFKNGIIDFKTGEFRKGKPTDYLFRLVPNNYDSTVGKPENFLKFLKSSFAYPEPKPEKPMHKNNSWYTRDLEYYEKDCIEWERKKEEHETKMLMFIQRLLGYILMGSGRERKIIIFWGPNGNNGKTTLMNILCSVFGEYAVSIDPNILLSKKFDTSAGAHSSHIIDWQDRRFLFADETEAGKRIDEGFVKRVTGNGIMVARGAYDKEQTRFEQTFTIILLTNNLPYIPVDDDASWRRLVIVPFLWSFVENPQSSKQHQKTIDKNLMDKIKDEHLEIIKWVVDGAMMYKEQNSLDVPKFVAGTAIDFREESDPFKSYFLDCIEPSDNAYVKVSSAYKVYKVWCRENNHRAVTRKSFKEHMERLGLIEDRRSPGMVFLDVFFNEETMKELFPDSDERKDISQNSDDDIEVDDSDPTPEEYQEVLHV